jgi:hypothetical protein
VKRHTIWSAIVKSNAHYTCIECGSTELIQAHDPTGKHVDPSVGQCLCAGHHADKHPNVPRALFFSGNKQPYWINISASSIAKQTGCHPRTIIRKAKKLGFTGKLVLGEEDINLLKGSFTKSFEHYHGSTKSFEHYHGCPNPEFIGHGFRLRAGRKVRRYICQGCGKTRSETLAEQNKQEVR